MIIFVVCDNHYQHYMGLEVQIKIILTRSHANSRYV